MILAFIIGEVSLPPRHEAFPDVSMMMEDIDRATRELHGGRLVRCVSDRKGPDVLIHIGPPTPFSKRSS